MSDPRALAALIFTVAVWGIVPVLFRNLSTELGPADHLVIRYCLVGAACAASLAVTGGWRVERRDWGRFAFASLVCFTTYNLGAAYGFAMIPAAAGSLILGMTPLLITLLSLIVNGERPSLTAVAGLVVAFVGTVSLVWSDLAISDDPGLFLIGCGLVFLCDLGWATYVLATKPLIQKYGAINVTNLSMFFCAIAIVPTLASPSTLSTAEAMSLRNWGEIIYVAFISTIVGIITWNYGAARLSAATAAAFLYLFPVIGVAGGALLLGETITAGMIGGGALILLGVAITQSSTFRRRDQPQPATD